jgi:hypothetical protein
MIIDEKLGLSTTVIAMFKDTLKDPNKIDDDNFIGNNRFYLNFQYFIEYLGYKEIIYLFKLYFSKFFLNSILMN